MICLSIEANNFQECIEIVKTHDFIELRLDKCNFANQEIKKILSYPIKYIATCRPGFHPDDKRIEILKNAILAGVDYIDIEFDSDEYFLTGLIKFSHKYDTKIILSYHNFNETPTLKILLDIINSCFEYGADIAKIACKANTIDDCMRILSLYDRISELIPNSSNIETQTSKIEHRISNIEFSQGGKLIAIGMGELGKITRIAAHFLGAPFTYASYKRGMETAEGQIDIKSLKKIFELMK